jgi:CBS domain-containing protein
MTAADLMTDELVVLREKMPLREAAQLLFRNQIHGAPVVNVRGECIGVLSTSDFMSLVEGRREDAPYETPSLPVTCGFQATHRSANGVETTICTLPGGVCAIQGTQRSPDGEELLVCRQPNCVPVEWQMVALEKLPFKQVRHFMTSNPVTASPETPVPELARKMIDARVQRIIVVDKANRVMGVVSTTDLLAVLACSNEASD